MESKYVINSKYEILNTKQIRNNKLQCFKLYRTKDGLGFGILEIGYCLGFRY